VYSDVAFGSDKPAWVFELPFWGIVRTCPVLITDLFVRLLAEYRLFRDYTIIFSNLGCCITLFNCVFCRRFCYLPDLLLQMSMMIYPKMPEKVVRY
jgi:hypothetical protein